MPNVSAPAKGRAQKQQRPWQEGDQEDRKIKPERLDVLEFGGEEAFEIVFDDEDAEEIGIAAGAEDVPGKCGEAESGDGSRMKKAECVAPALVKSAQKKTAPPLRMIAAGPFARTAKPRKKPQRIRASQGVRGSMGVFSSRVRPRTTAAQTMAMVSMPLKGMSVAAACENPIMPTVVGRSSSSQRAVSAP